MLVLFKCPWNILRNRPCSGTHTGLNRYQKTEIIPCILSEHTTLKLELNHEETFGRNSKTWRLRTIMLRNDSINQKIKNQIKQFMETNENESTTLHNLWDTAKAVLRGKYIAIQASLKRIEKSKMQFYILTSRSWNSNRGTGLTH